MLQGPGDRAAGDQGALVIEALQAAIDKLEEEGGDTLEEEPVGSGQADERCRLSDEREGVSAETSYPLPGEPAKPSPERANALVCLSECRLDGHHLVHRADGGATSLENLVLLRRHHRRLGHEGGFGAHPDAGGRIRFTTPAGAVIPEAPPGRALTSPLEKRLETFQLRRGLRIDARTADCHWRGEPMDYDHAGWLLMQTAMKEEAGEGQPSG